MVEKTVPIRRDTDTATQEAIRAPERHITPPVDIYETDDGLVVIADLPGVQKDQLEIKVADDILTIVGHPKVHTAGEERYREYGLKDFFRQFELTDAVRQDGITAHFQHGVLTLTLPNAEQAKPRRIPVHVG